MTLEEELQQKKKELKEALNECLEADRAIQPAQNLRETLFDALEESSRIPFDELLRLHRYSENYETARQRALQFSAIAEELARLEQRKAAGFG